MSVLQSIRCKLGSHTWGVLKGDNWGGYRDCTYCGKSKRLGPTRPPEAHDKLDLGK